MKTCPQCNAALPDSAAFCTHCGAKLDAAPAAEVPTPEAVSAPAAEAAAPAPEAPKPPKKKSPLLFIIPIAVLVIAVAGFFIYRTVSLNNEIASLMEEAQEYIDKEKYKQAISRYESVLELKENHADAQAGLAAAQTALQIRDTIEEADAALARGNTDEAIKLYNEAISLGGDDPAIHAGLTSANLSLARAQLNEGELDKAKAILDKLNVKPSDGFYDEYTQLTSVVNFGAQVESVDALNYPTLSLTFTFAPDADLYRIGGFDVREPDGSYCDVRDWDPAAEPGKLTLTCWTEAKDDWGAERDLAVTMYVDGFPLSLTAPYQVPSYPEMEIPLYCSYTDQPLQDFADLVSQRTGGRVTLSLQETYDDSSQLVYEACYYNLEGIIYASSDGLSSEYAPRAFVLRDAPFLFDSYENLRKTVDNFILSWLNEDDGSPLHTLAVTDGYFSQFLSLDHPIQNVADLVHSSIGTPYSYLCDSALGSSLNPIAPFYSVPIPDAYYDLENGSLGAIILSSGYAAVTSDYLSGAYLSLANCTFTPYFLFAGNNYWDGLPADLQAILTQAAADAAQSAWDRAEGYEADTLNVLPDRGVNVVDADRDSFRDALFASVMDSFDWYGLAEEAADLYAAAAANR